MGEKGEREKEKIEDKCGENYEQVLKHYLAVY